MPMDELATNLAPRCRPDNTITAAAASVEFAIYLCRFTEPIVFATICMNADPAGRIRQRSCARTAPAQATIAAMTDAVRLSCRRVPSLLNFSLSSRPCSRRRASNADASHAGERTKGCRQLRYMWHRSLLAPR
jgi:hypothetical protein